MIFTYCSNDLLLIVATDLYPIQYVYIHTHSNEVGIDVVVLGTLNGSKDHSGLVNYAGGEEIGRIATTINLKKQDALRACIHPVRNYLPYDHMTITL